jgi:MoxR-like ATPase
VNPQQLTIEKVQEILLKEKYVCDRALATVVYLSLVMGKPLLLEGEAGVGKTEIAKVLSKVLGSRLIRLQCYEGLDANTGALRMELSQADAPHQARRDRAW